MSGRSFATVGPLLAVVLAACAVSVPSGRGPTAAPHSGATPAVGTRPPPSVAPTLVGEWLGVHRCGRIRRALVDAGLPAQVLPNIVDSGVLPGINSVDQVPDPSRPCAGAVEVPHSHFFTADGEFGSRDASGARVDDGRWTLIDSTTFSIGDAEFTFEIMGDELRMQPVDVGRCPRGPTEWCEEAWKVMVAMPGMAWTRGNG